LSGSRSVTASDAAALRAASALRDGGSTSR
jgi:hypothetical protein